MGFYWSCWVFGKLKGAWNRKIESSYCEENLGMYFRDLRLVGDWRDITMRSRKMAAFL